MIYFKTAKFSSKEDFSFSSDELARDFSKESYSRPLEWEKDYLNDEPTFYEED